MAEQRRRTDAVAIPIAGARALAGTRSAPPRRRPSHRSLLVALGLVLAAGVLYLIARETSAFAVRSIEVDGAPPGLAARVRQALAPLEGRSLVSLDRRDVRRRVLALPEIASASVDRAFPHTLRLTVGLERPVAVLRQADRAWVASATGRVLRELPSRPYPRLPRIWLPPTVHAVLGSTLAGETRVGLRVAGALAGMRLRAGVQTVRAASGELKLVLGSGIEVRLGDLEDLRLKLAIAARLVPLARGARYLDVTVPERAVAAYNSKAAG